jgi:hypothetical protein
MARRYAETQRAFNADGKPAEGITSAAQRRRGRVHFAVAALPYLVCWGAGLITTLSVGRRSFPDDLPYIVGLYACAGWFAMIYVFAWRAGHWVGRFAHWTISLAFHVVLVLVHSDQAATGSSWVADVELIRPAEPWANFAGGAVVAGMLVMLLHLLILGTGSREPRGLIVPIDFDANADPIGPNGDRDGNREG